MAQLLPWQGLTPVLINTIEGNSRTDVVDIGAGDSVTGKTEPVDVVVIKNDDIIN